jgi:hypothetical protein
MSRGVEIDDCFRAFLRVFQWDVYLVVCALVAKIYAQRGDLNMAAPDSYAVTLTGKCGPHIEFSKVACINLNVDFRQILIKQQKTNIKLVFVSVKCLQGWVTDIG